MWSLSTNINPSCWKKLKSVLLFVLPFWPALIFAWLQRSFHAGELILLSTAPFSGTVFSWIPAGSLLETHAGKREVRGGQGEKTREL